MTGDPKCPACETVSPSRGVYKYTCQYCTGRAGCVRTAPVPPVPATSGADSGATPIMPDGWEQNAQPTDPLLLALSMGMKVGPAVAQQAAAEIARLRAEVERLTGERDHWISRAHHDAITVELLDDYAGHLEADRAALAQRVAEAVREAIRECQPSVSRHQWMSDEACTRAEAIEEWRKDIDAIDIAAIVAAALKEGE
jgi:hypothetical protein